MSTKFLTLPEDEISEIAAISNANYGPLKNITGTGVAKDEKGWYYSHLLSCGHLVIRRAHINGQGWLRPPVFQTRCGHCKKELENNNPVLKLPLAR